MRKGSFLRLPSGPCTLAGLSAIALTTVVVPAHAAIPTMVLPSLVESMAACGARAQPLSPASAPVASLTKAAAVLGGAPSALDLIRAQQAGSLEVTAPAPTLLAEASVTLPTLTPGIEGSLAPSPMCAGLAASRISPKPGMLQPRVIADPEEFLASKRIRIARTNFDRDWKRVRSETISPGQFRRYLGTLPQSPTDSLAAVNRWVNHHIAYEEDRDQYGVADFWAGARRTLKAGRGDCEDIALTKMQLLAAAGVPRDDMILTIARDLVRNADHAVLIVRTDAGFRLLDNATDEVLDAAPSQDYRAILSLGNHFSWLHGV